MCKKIILVMALVLTLTGSSFAANYYVAAGAAGTGASWTDALGSLDSALAVAASGDTVYVAMGRYIPSGTSFSVAAGVTIKAGYSNYWTSYGNITNIGEFFNPKAYPVVLSGDTNGDDKQADLYGDPYALSSAAAVNRTDNKAIMSLGGSATIEGAVFYHGGTDCYGPTGAISCSGGVVVISNCQFLGCAGSQIVACGSATVTFNGCLIYDGSYSSAAIRAAGNLTLTKCTFKGNSNAAEYGNGIYWDGPGTFTMTDCLTADSISGNASAFGTVYVRTGDSADGTVNISKCAFLNDTADASPCWIGNDASMNLGRILTVNVSNTLWAGCMGHTGNACFLVRTRRVGNTSTFNLTNVTMADNKDGGYTGGLKAYSGTALAPSNLVINLKNSILWGNSGAQVSWHTGTLSFTDTTYNPFKISYCCIDTVDPNNYPAINPISGIPTGLVVANPQFVGGGDYHLQSTSPCIDKGDPASSYANEPKWLNGCRVNMGAYGNTAEAATTTTCVALTADTNGDCRVNNADLLTLRGQWLKTCP